MAKKISTKPPSGMRDFLPLDIARRRHVIATVTEVYEAHGFVPLETPSIENLSTLTGKYGDEGDQLLYRLLHRRDKLARAAEKAHGEGRPADEAELAEQGLRYDLTVPLARVVAQYGELPKFFKRYQIQPVWRADRPGRGRFREFYQCDVDVTGTTSLIAEAEVCSAVATVLEKLGFADFEIRLNHRQLLRALIARAGIDVSLEGTALVGVDKLDKIGREGVLNELAERGIAAGSAEQLLELMVVPEGTGNEAVLERLEAAGLEARGTAALAGLRELLALTAETPAGRHLRIAPELARGLSYYTGPIFEIAVPDLAGSLGGGGRYDELVGMFGKQQVPAVGFSIGLERILVVMEERGMYPELSSGPEVMLCWMDVGAADVMRVATVLRGQGLRVETYPEAQKLGKQLQYADTVQAGVAAILGKDELSAGQIALKHLESGTQERVALADASGAIDRLRAAASATSE